jgi:hypothetical protein
MRDHEKNLRVLTQDESITSGSVDVPVAPPASFLSLADWDALPLSVRASERLADMLLALRDIETDLSTDEAAGLRWIEPAIRAIGTRVSSLLQLLAS